MILRKWYFILFEYFCSFYKELSVFLALEIRISREKQINVNLRL